MTKHDVRLRKQRMTSGRIRSHKNFNYLIDRHNRSNRIRKVLQIVVYALAILGIIALLYYAAM